jgi:hypothetical protein
VCPGEGCVDTGKLGAGEEVVAPGPRAAVAGRTEGEACVIPDATVLGEFGFEVSPPGLTARGAGLTEPSEDMPKPFAL